MRSFVRGCTVMVFALAAACAPKAVPVPVVTAPRFPEFMQPPVPAELAATPAAQNHERAWTFLQAGDLRTADRELETALRTNPAFYPAETAAGYVELARRDPKAALAHFDRALEQHADYVSALVGRGQALVALERESEAIHAFEAAVAADPSLTDLKTRIEVLTFRALERDLASARRAAKAGRADEAVRLYREAIEASPDSPFLYRERAIVEAGRGDDESALEDFRRAVSLDPTDATSKLRIAELLDKRGDSEAALRAYDEAIAIEPNDQASARREDLRTRMELARLPDQYRAIAGAPQITRADLAALVAVRLGPALTATSSGDAVVVTDVRGNWAEPWIMTVVRAGVMDAFENHTFQPRSSVSRAELAETVSRLLPHLASEASVRGWQRSTARFSDIEPGHLAYPAAAVATASGVMPRTSDGRFDPARPVTGAEVSAAVERLRAMAPRAVFTSR